jgi:hypothetical protein
MEGGIDNIITPHGLVEFLSDGSNNKEDIVCLPVHDAIAVQQGHEDWAKEVMLETWQEHAKDVGTKVKVDYP